MPLFAEQSPNVFLVSAVALAVWAFIVVWAVVFARWRQCRPVIPYQPRRPVPWRMFDVLLLLIVFSVAPAFFVNVSRNWLDVSPPAQSQVDEEPELDGNHPLARVLMESSSGWAVLMCVVLAVVVTPIAEEFIFRLLIQGWLESLERRLRRRVRLPRGIAVGIAPVAFVSLMFAAMHFRVPEPQVDITALVAILCAIFASNLLIIVLSVCWLRFVAGASLADLGFVPGKLLSDVKLGLLAFIAVIPLVYAVAFAAKELLPENAIVDPIPLLLFAVALGVLYFRTHRIVPAIVLHMTFNAMGVIMAFMALSSR